jgi:hypothetical protein
MDKKANLFVGFFELSQEEKSYAFVFFWLIYLWIQKFIQSTSSNCQIITIWESMCDIQDM